MSEQDNIQTVHASFAALNEHALDRLGSSLASDFVSHIPGNPNPLDHAKYMAFLQDLLTAYPGVHYDITRTIAQGDTVVAHWTLHGTHTGSLHTSTGNTIPPTGKPVIVPGTTTVDFKNGKIAGMWSMWDRASLLNQLGLLPNM